MSKQKRISLLAPALLLMLLGPATSARAQTSPVEIKVEARRFEFTPKTITVRRGEPVRLLVTSADTDHGFAIKEFNINEEIAAGTTRTVEFTPDRAGRFRFYCSVYCGDLNRRAAHLKMEFK